LICVQHDTTSATSELSVHHITNPSVVHSVALSGVFNDEHSRDTSVVHAWYQHLQWTYGNTYDDINKNFQMNHGCKVIKQHISDSCEQSNVSNNVQKGSTSHRIRI